MDPLVINIDAPDYAILERLDSLRKLNFKLYIEKSFNTADLALNLNKLYLLYSIMIQMASIGEDVSAYIPHIAKNSKSSFHLLNLATSCKNVNVSLLEDGIVRIGNIIDIAKFAGRVKGANKERLEKIIKDYRSPSAAYTYLKLNPDASIEEYEDILYESNKPKYLYTLALHCSCSKRLRQLEKAILSGDSNLYVRLFAKNVKGADLEMCEERIISTYSFKEYKRYYKSVPSFQMEKLLLLF